MEASNTPNGYRKCFSSTLSRRCSFQRCAKGDIPRLDIDSYKCTSSVIYKLKDMKWIWPVLVCLPIDLIPGHLPVVRIREGTEHLPSKLGIISEKQKCLIGVTRDLQCVIITVLHCSFWHSISSQSCITTWYNLLFYSGVCYSVIYQLSDYLSIDQSQQSVWQCFYRWWWYSRSPSY